MTINFVSSTNQLVTLKKQLDQKNRKEINLDQISYIIQKPAVKVQRQRVQISEEQFIKLCRLAKKHTLHQPSLLRLEGPIHVSTGTLGNYVQLANIIGKCGNPKFVNYLFLGNYAGRYGSSVQCLVAYFVYKSKMPNNFFMIRGSYQSIAMAKNYNLQTQLLSYFGTTRPWLQVCQFFCCLPFAAVIDQKIFCVHGGLSPSIQYLQQINKIKRPVDTSQKEEINDLVWSDPSHIYPNWTQNDRGIGVSFGQNIIYQFTAANNLQLICRGHEVAYDGFQFFSDKKLVTITSLSNYCHLYTNKSAVMMVDDKSNVIFKIIQKKLTSEEKDVEDTLTFTQILDRRKQRQLKEKELQLQEQQRQNYQNEIKRKKKQQKQEKSMIIKLKQQKKRRRKIRQQMLRQLQQSQSFKGVQKIFQNEKQQITN